MKAPEPSSKLARQTQAAQAPTCLMFRLSGRRMALDRPAYGNVYGYEGTRYNQACHASIMPVTAITNEERSKKTYQWNAQPLHPLISYHHSLSWALVLERRGTLPAHGAPQCMHL